MQYIHKRAAAPSDWDEWFTTATRKRSFDYKTDYSQLTRITEVRKYLLKEQHYLCAYCQRQLKLEDSSIEHVIPKSLNIPFSTVYHNLVAVCNKPLKDIKGKLHCDIVRADKLLSPIIFYNNAQVVEYQDHETIKYNNHHFFDVYADGSIIPKRNLREPVKGQVQSFLELLNLNHPKLKDLRKNALEGIIDLFQEIPRHQQQGFLRAQLQSILADKNRPFRQFLLIYLAKNCGF